MGLQSVINCPTTGRLILFLADQALSPRGGIIFFSEAFHVRSFFLSRLVSNLSSDDGHETHFGPIRWNGKPGNSWEMFSSLIKELDFLFRTPVNGIWICGNNLADMRWKKHRWKTTMSEMSDQKNGGNLPPRWHSRAIESSPITTYLRAFREHKPP